MIWDGLGMFLGFWNDLASTWDGSGIDLGSIRIELGLIWGRFGVDLGSI